MGVSNGLRGGNLSSSMPQSTQLHFLSDPLAPVRALTIHHPNSKNPLRLSYSNSNGSDHSLIKLDFGTKSALNDSSSTGGGSAGSPVGRRSFGESGGIPRVTEGKGMASRSRKSKSFSSRGDANYQLFTIDLSSSPKTNVQQKRSLSNLNGTLDVPHLPKQRENDNSAHNNSICTLDLPHPHMNHPTPSSVHHHHPPPNGRKDSFNNSHSDINRTSSAEHQSSENNHAYPPPKIPGRKVSSRNLHGVFHSRLSGPLASLQPITSESAGKVNNKSGRSRKKRHSAISFFTSQKDKENIVRRSSSPYHPSESPVENPNLPSMLHQLAWMCRRHNDSLSSSSESPTLDQTAIHTRGSRGPLPPPPLSEHVGGGGLGAQGDVRRDLNDTRRARKVSTALRALAGRINSSLTRGEEPIGGVRPFASPPQLESSLSSSSSFSSDSGDGSNNAANSLGSPDSPQKRLVRALYDYKAAQKGDLSLVQDEEYEVLEETEEHWWKLKDKHGNEGYSPSNYVKVCTDIGLHQYDWYLGDATRQRAETILMREEREGCFVVRNSTSTSGMYTISVYCSMSRPQVKHYHIQKDGDCKYYLSQNIKCNSIAELIYKHQYNPGGLCTRLRSAPHGNKPPATAGFGRDKWDIPLTEIVLMEEIGSGQFGVVKRGRYRGMDVAVKMMKEGTMSEDEFIEEAKVMTKLQHPNLVQLYGVCRRQRPVYIITEFLEYGSLLHYLRQKEKSLITKTDTLVDMCLQIADGMAYLEKEKFIHRDLAARNCLVGSKNIKVGDFGLARYVVDDEYTGSGGAKFPIKWAAPEVLNYMRFSSKSDVWAFGVLMWEVFTCGKMPYGRRKNADVVAMVQEGIVLDQPRYCPNNVYQVMRECWEQTADQRPTFTHLRDELTSLNSEEC